MPDLPIEKVGTDNRRGKFIAGMRLECEKVGIRSSPNSVQQGTLKLI